MFADGISWKEPMETAPEWIIGNFSVKVDKFKEFLDQHVNERGWVNFDVKRGKSGNVYVALNTWKPGTPVGEQKVAPTKTVQYPTEDLGDPKF